MSPEIFVANSEKWIGAVAEVGGFVIQKFTPIIEGAFSVYLFMRLRSQESDVQSLTRSHDDNVKKIEDLQKTPSAPVHIEQTFQPGASTGYSGSDAPPKTGIPGPPPDAT